MSGEQRVARDHYKGVCLIEKVSKRETTALTVKSNGKKAYGLYQIPSEWCKEGKRGGRCNIKCEALLDDDIRDDTACALKIMEEHGFQYWSLWTTRCKNDNFITNEIYKRRVRLARCPTRTRPECGSRSVLHAPKDPNRPPQAGPCRADVQPGLRGERGISKEPKLDMFNRKQAIVPILRNPYIHKACNALVLQISMGGTDCLPSGT
ncbi:unnamed protein product [Spodoptera exigua]|nr:unnamed protein product [Spodoptera exigua]